MSVPAKLPDDVRASLRRHLKDRRERSSVSVDSEILRLQAAFPHLSLDRATLEQAIVDDATALGLALQFGIESKGSEKA